MCYVNIFYLKFRVSASRQGKNFLILKKNDRKTFDVT
uniref:Uncharacterized protein n=1 Tax=Arundo donax TaxID=35708 RepID=A0A0A8Z8Z2_ARUDO